MKKVLGLALVATFLATPAFGGEAFVRNEDSWSHSTTKTDLNLYSNTNSYRTEHYNAWADKIYLDGDVTSRCSFCGGTTVSYDDFSVHTAGSNLWGYYSEQNWTNVYGKINTTTNAGTSGHETSAGIR